MWAARLERLQVKITTLEKKLYPDFTTGMNTNSCSAPDESYTSMLDIDSWAKFWLVNEIMSNNELVWPKSSYATFNSTDNLLKAGPVWDFDWASLEKTSSCSLKNTIYYNALFKSPSFKSKVKEVWAEKTVNIDISARIEEIRDAIALAAGYDAKLWGVNHNPVTAMGYTSLSFDDINGHVNFLKSVLTQKLSVVNSEVNGL